MKHPKKDTIHSIIVRCPNWIGDAIMALPAIEDIREIFPQAHIVGLASEPIAELFSTNTVFNEFLVFSRALEKKKSDSQRIISELKKRNFDLGILLTRSFSSAWMFWRGNVTWRLGFKDHFRSLLLNIGVPLPETETHDVLSYRKLLLPFGGSQKERKLLLPVPEEEKSVMKEKLALLCGDKELIIINPGAAYGSAKCWPKERFRSVANELLAEGKSIIFIGDAKGKALVDEIMEGLSGQVFNFAGKTTIRQLIALLSLSRCVLSNDSGPMHIASALNKPLVAIFGSTNPQRTGPFNTGIVLKKNIPCAPCYLRKCPKNFECMLSISVQEVLEAIRKTYDLS